MGALDGKVALVTGASRGIGKAVALELARHGANVAVNYHANKDMADAVAKEVQGLGTKATVVQADVSQPEEAKRMVDETVNALGEINVLVNNAGTTHDRTLRRMSVEEWDSVINTNLNGVFYTTNAAVHSLERAGGGHIVMMSSVVAEMGNVGLVNYGSTKAALIGFVKTASQELWRYGIRVNAVAPGFIETDMIAGLNQEQRQRLLDKTIMGRFGEPQEVATLVRYLVSEGSYITGQVIRVNGGMYI